MASYSSQARLSDLREKTDEDLETTTDYPPPPSPINLRKKSSTSTSSNCDSPIIGYTPTAMPREETDSVAESTEDSEFYEAYWAQNTSAHGVSRIANTHKFHKVVWILALLGCFAYVTYEIYRSIDLFNQHLTTTEINQHNRKKLDFPSVTFCNFNRWRNSKLTPEVRKQLEEVLAVYSYDYVIPDINDGVDPDKVELQELIAPKTTLAPTTPPASTTVPPPVECKLPGRVPGLVYDVAGSVTNESKVAVGTTITYRCTMENATLEDGETVHTCGEDGKFSQREPICVTKSLAGYRYVLANSGTNSQAIAVSSTLDSTHYDRELESVTLCFWIRTTKEDNLGTLLSYGVGDETILSVEQAPQTSTSGNIYGVKYMLFGNEGRLITLTSYDQWSPFCLQYSTANQDSKSESSLKLYKFLVLANQENRFLLYEDTTVATNRNFPLGGNLVMFNSYEGYLNVLAGRSLGSPSAGGQVANINIWDRLIPVSIMNNLLWNGNIFSLTADQVASSSAVVSATHLFFNVSVHQIQALSVIDSSDIQTTMVRAKRQVDNFDGMTTIAGNISSAVNATSAANATTPGSTSTTTDPLESVFNYADFTRAAGWQLVDAKSGHDSSEPKTLLSCTFRGKPCDSRWFVHKFGAYGNCYTFNQDISKSFAKEQGMNYPLFQDNAGPTGGLNILLDIQTWEYSESTTLNGNSELGLKLIVHPSYEVPVINSMGYAVAPGQKAFVGFSKTTTTNLEEPWGKCNESRTLKYNTNYTLNACLIECKLERVVTECGCKPYYFPGQYDVCNFQELDECAFVEIAKVNADFTNLCNCPVACKREDYSVKLSYTDFPNSPYGRDLGTKLNISLPPATPGIPSYDSKSQYLKGNVANLDLYFETMTEVEINQNKAMDDTALLGVIGGQLGLFIGCSFLTAFEFLECIVMSVLYHCKRGAKKKQKKKNNWVPATTTLDAELGNGTQKLYDNGAYRHSNSDLHSRQI